MTEEANRNNHILSVRNESKSELEDEVSYNIESKHSRLIRKRFVRLQVQMQIISRVFELWPSNEYWTTSAIEEELVYEMSSALTYTIDKDTSTIHIRNKYYEQAEFNLYRMNAWNPPPEFVINRSDLTPRLLSELGNLYKSYPKKFRQLLPTLCRLYWRQLIIDTFICII